MGWATAHSQFCVKTLQWCCDRMGTTYTTGALVRTIENLCSHGGVPGEAHRNKPPWVLCRDRVGSPCVATGFWAARVLVSRHGFGVAPVMLHRGLVSCHDMTFVSRQGWLVGVATRPGWLGGVSI